MKLNTKQKHLCFNVFKASLSVILKITVQVSLQQSYVIKAALFFVLIDSSFHSAWCLGMNKKMPSSFLLVRAWFTLEIGTFKSQTQHPPSLVTVQITMQNCNVQYRVFMFALQSTLDRTIEALHLIWILNIIAHVLPTLFAKIYHVDRIIT